MSSCFHIEAMEQVTVILLSMELPRMPRLHWIISLSELTLTRLE
ncbi:hypothetical protein SLEP1_g56656 [Rubroshorea leprosula]|uniref:Uncharacterized protein n=1 Tax=Rubroshorea leprosula TaxID=152421 RepID=A0AAV5MK66_9ROSI|nr:hypothetical protein SLEP1_g56656 [Rubroshorea leprosula]